MIIFRQRRGAVGQSRPAKEGNVIRGAIATAELAD